MKLTDEQKELGRFAIKRNNLEQYVSWANDNWVIVDMDLWDRADLLYKAGFEEMALKEFDDAYADYDVSGEIVKAINLFLITSFFFIFKTTGALGGIFFLIWWWFVGSKL